MPRRIIRKKGFKKEWVNEAKIKETVLQSGLGRPYKLVDASSRVHRFHQSKCEELLLIIALRSLLPIRLIKSLPHLLNQLVPLDTPFEIRIPLIPPICFVQAGDIARRQREYIPLVALRNQLLDRVALRVKVFELGGWIADI
jgi:hypothetical protein